MSRRYSESVSSSSRSRSGSNSSAASVGHFMEFFEAESGIKEVEVIIGRNRYGRLVTEALIEYMSMRVEVEQQYAKGLEKLSKFQFPAAEPIMVKALKPYGGFDKVYQENFSVHFHEVLAGVQIETAALANGQKNFAKSIETGVLDALKQSFNSQVGTKLKHKYRLFDSAEQITKLQKVLTQYRAKSLEFQQKCTITEGAANANPDDRKARNNYEQARNNFDSYEQKARDTERMLEGKQRDFQCGLAQAAREIYDNELARLHLSYEKLDELSGLIREHQGATQAFLSNLALHLARGDAGMELLDFARKYAGRRAIESSPAAEACYDEVVRTRPWSWNASPPKPLLQRKPLTYKYSEEDYEQTVPSSHASYENEYNEFEEY